MRVAAGILGLAVGCLALLFGIAVIAALVVVIVLAVRKTRARDERLTAFFATHDLTVTCDEPLLVRGQWGGHEISIERIQARVDTGKSEFGHQITITGGQTPRALIQYKRRFSELQSGSPADGRQVTTEDTDFDATFRTWVFGDANPVWDDTGTRRMALAVGADQPQVHAGIIEMVTLPGQVRIIVGSLVAEPEVLAAALDLGVAVIERVHTRAGPGNQPG
jgi:hypothetical protein